MKQITLSGFGDFSDNKSGYTELKAAAKAHGVEFYPTYYDHELKGDRAAIEAITQYLWSMGSDEWIENGLTESEIDPV